MINRLIGLIAFLCFVAYLGVLIVIVDETALRVVLGIVIAMTGYEFYRQLSGRSSGQ